VGRLAGFFDINEIHRSINPEHKIHASVFERIAAFNGKNPSYAPAANLADGSPFPKNLGDWNPARIVETPDYLKRVMSVTHA
jgi:hypothetical protein